MTETAEGGLRWLSLNIKEGLNVSLKVLGRNHDRRGNQLGRLIYR